MPNDKLLSADAPSTTGVHTKVRIFQNGGLAGTITVEAHVAERVCELINGATEVEDELREEVIKLRRMNPYVVARALHLYRYNVSQAVRITDWWERRFPDSRLSQESADKWYERFGGDHPVEVPKGMDPWSLVAFVANAMDRFGDEVAREYGGCGKYSAEELLNTGGDPASWKHMFCDGGWTP